MARLKQMLPDRGQLGLEIVKKLYILGKTQRELAAETGVSETYISLIINGRNTPGPELTRKLAQVLLMDEQEIRQLVLEALKAS